MQNVPLISSPREGAGQMFQYYSRQAQLLEIYIACVLDDCGQRYIVYSYPLRSRGRRLEYQ